VGDERRAGVGVVSYPVAFLYIVEAEVGVFGLDGLEGSSKSVLKATSVQCSATSHSSISNVPLRINQQRWGFLFALLSALRGSSLGVAGR